MRFSPRWIFFPALPRWRESTIEPERTIDGKDASALITGQPGAKSPWSHFYYYFGTELHAVRENQYKLRAQNILHNEDIYRRDEFTSAPVPAALYDLSQDPGEQKSILKDRPEILKHLETLLDQERQTLGDILTGAKGRENRPPGFSEHPVDPKSK